MSELHAVKKKPFLWPLVIIIVLLMGSFAYYIVAVCIQDDEKYVMLITPEDMENMPDNQIEIITQVVSTEIEEPVFIEKLDDSDLSFLVDYEKNETYYDFEISYQWHMEQNTKGDAFFFAFADEEWVLVRNDGFYDGDTNKVVYDRASFGVFSGACYQLDQSNLQQGKIKITLKPLVTNPQADILIGYVQKNSIITAKITKSQKLILYGRQAKVEFIPWEPQEEAVEIIE